MPIFAWSVPRRQVLTDHCDPEISSGLLCNHHRWLLFQFFQLDNVGVALAGALCHPLQWRTHPVKNACLYKTNAPHTSAVRRQDSWQNIRKMCGTQTVSAVTHAYVLDGKLWELCGKNRAIVMRCFSPGSVRRIQLHRCGRFAAPVINFQQPVSILTKPEESKATFLRARSYRWNPTRAHGRWRCAREKKALLLSTLCLGPVSWKTELSFKKYQKMYQLPFCFLIFDKYKTSC